MTRQSPDGQRSIREQALRFIGMAVRARRAVLGSDAALKAVQTGEASMVLLASDCGGNARKKYRDKCAFYHISLFEVFSRKELAEATGRSTCVVLAITDPGFAAKMMDYVGEFDGGEVFDETSRV